MKVDFTDNISRTLVDVIGPAISKAKDATNILVESIVEDFIAEIDYSLPHASPKDIERIVNYTLVVANVDDTEFDFEQKYALYRMALGKMREIIRSLS